MSSLENLRKAAKRWLRALRANDRDALARYRHAHPHGPVEPGLRDVQHALAREQGADNWPALKQQATAATGDPLTDLLGAAETGDAARIIELIARHPELINTRGHLRGHSGLRTALHFGIDHEPVVRALVEHGADPNIRDEGDNAMPLHFAAERQDFPVIRLLIEHGADPIGAGDGHELEVIGWSCCWDYVETNRELVDYLLAHGARHHIFSAVTLGEADVIRELVAAAPAQLARRMDRTNIRRTALHQAVVKNQSGSVVALLDLDADTDALDAAGLTALDEAALRGYRDLAQVLIDRGASVRLPAAVALGRSADIERLVHDDPDCLKPGQSFDTLIVRAAAVSSAPVIETLLRLGADVNARDHEATAVDQTGGYTPLHAAAWANNEDAVRALLRHGADVNAREDKYGSTPAGWANYAGHTALRDVILRGPIDIFQAIEFDRVEAIPQLLKRDPGALDRALRGQTPLAYAQARGNVEAVRFLTEAGAAGAPAAAAIEAPADAHAGRVARFLGFACWDHFVHGKGDHRMHDRAAQRLLAAHPEIARDSIFTAVVCGEREHVERILAERPAAARERGGARHWTPLLYLTYARFTQAPAIDHAVPIARALLDAGANPNDYYMAGDSRYSTLTGVAREGEQDAPPHPQREALYELLLERGADPFDLQVLYNTHFHGSLLWWLEPTYTISMRTGRARDWADPDWRMFDMGGYGSGARYMLGVAIAHDDVALARWLLAHGASPMAAAAADPRYSKRSLYEDAIARGSHDLAALLVQYGATPVTPQGEGEDLYVDACLRGDRAAAESLLRQHPGYLQSPRALFEAARRNRPDAIRLLLDLGTPVDAHGPNNVRALHQAAMHNAIEAATVLIERGAEIDPRDAQHGSPPIGWAAYADHQPMLDLLSRHSRDVFRLAFRGYVTRLRDVLQEEPSLAKAVNDNGITPLWWLPDDEQAAVEIVTLLLSHGADAGKVSKNGRTAADWADERGLTEAAALLRRAGGRGVYHPITQSPRDGGPV